jgi:hypothetical protein
LLCPDCGYENPEGRRFCEECGQKLASVQAEKARARRRTLREAARYRRDAEKDGLDAEEAERRRRRSRRRTSPWIGLLLLAVIVAVVIVLIVVLSGGESGPEKAVKEFYGAIVDKDVETFLKHTEPELYKQVRNGEIELTPYEAGIEYENYVLEDLETRLVTEEGDYAEVEVIGGYFEGFISDGSGSGGIDFAVYPRLIKLIKIEDTWIIQEYGSMSRPYPLPEFVEGESEFPEVEEQVEEPS